MNVRQIIATPKLPVAWNSHCQRIGAARLAHRPHRLRRADAAGNLGIGGCLSQWDLAQRLPDALLKSRPAYIQREVQSDPWCFDKTDYLGYQLFKIPIPAAQVGLRKAVLQLANKRLRIVTHKDGAQAALGFSHQD